MYISKCQCCGDSLTPHEKQEINHGDAPPLCDHCNEDSPPAEPQEEIYTFSDADPGM